jgi:sterol desaturase/sphingolipid hydroxylase (fatty acid hydroxylase superfamily)
LHRWHHDPRPGRSQVNFSCVLSVWDRFFGTVRHTTTEHPGRPGLDAASAGQVPKDPYWAQFFGPLPRFSPYATDVDKDSR